jgi:hypothetical protein
MLASWKASEPARERRNLQVESKLARERGGICLQDGEQVGA